MKSSALLKLNGLAKKYKKIVLVLILAVNIFGVIIGYENYIQIAVELSQIKSYIFTYCATATAIASISIVFMLIGKEDLGDFIALFSVSWLMFFGLIAVVLAFIYPGSLFEWRILLESIGWILIHAFMFFEGLFFIGTAKIKNIFLPLVLGAVVLSLYLLASMDFMQIVIFWFFKAQ
ncbi:MAG: hypothetical protein PHW96_00190 [Candidatus Nanoarchaeia archaeon]|nr:hypothetical protein [Candidatus Nanoarchaeia archaeon]